MNAAINHTIVKGGERRDGRISLTIKLVGWRPEDVDRLIRSIAYGVMGYTADEARRIVDLLAELDQEWTPGRPWA